MELISEASQPRSLTSRSKTLPPGVLSPSIPQGLCYPLPSVTWLVAMLQKFEKSHAHAILVFASLYNGSILNESMLLFLNRRKHHNNICTPILPLRKFLSARLPSMMQTYQFAIGPLVDFPKVNNLSSKFYFDSASSFPQRIPRL